MNCIFVRKTLALDDLSLEFVGYAMFFDIEYDFIISLSYFFDFSDKISPIFLKYLTASSY